MIGATKETLFQLKKNNVIVWFKNKIIETNFNEENLKTKIYIRIRYFINGRFNNNYYIRNCIGDYNELFRCPPDMAVFDMEAELNKKRDTIYSKINSVTCCKFDLFSDLYQNKFGFIEVISMFTPIIVNYMNYGKRK